VEWDRPIVSKLFGRRAYFLGGSLRHGERIAFDVTSTGDATYSDEELNDNLWHLAVGTYDGSLSSANLKLYIDGRLQTKTYIVGCDIEDIPESLGIGANIDQFGDSFYPWDFFVGSIDDVRIYNRALTASEVHDLYVIPVPSAFLLGTLGLSFAGWKLRKRKTS
jgi:hypothetical protein